MGLWYKELLSYKQFPPTYNLDGILKAMEDQKRNPSD
jgi:hypothetical protein